MTDIKKADQQASPKKTHAQDITPIPAPTKIARVLMHLLSGQSLNRFEAERNLGDHTLNSTISALHNDYGLSFARVPEKVPTRWGKPCEVIRYSLPESQLEKARQALAMMSSRRAAA